MSLFSIKEIIRATGSAVLKGNACGKVKGVSIDTRTLRKGDLFVAIKGNRYDGHQFIVQALKKGAAAILTSDGVAYPKAPVVLKVKDTTKALGDLALFYRQKFKIPLIAITGSAGKTTTKEMIASVLRSKYNVLKNRGSENNQFGVPLTLLNLRPRHDIAVLELGTNQPGDIQNLARICKPTMAVFTNVGVSHLERLKSVRGVFNEKSQLLQYLAPRGTVILNKDDVCLKEMIPVKRNRSLRTYSRRNPSDYQARAVRSLTPLSTVFSVNGRWYVIKSSLEHNIYNALAAICCGEVFDIRYNNINNSLKRFKFAHGRGETKKINGVWLIDDTYNANPVSFQSMIDSLDRFKALGKKIVVCGDMLELGVKAKEYHRFIGEKIALSTIDTVLTIGPLAASLAEGIKESPKHVNIFSYQNRQALHKKIKALCQPHNVFLVKGSRAMSMEKTVNYIKKQLT